MRYIFSNNIARSLILLKGERPLVVKSLPSNEVDSSSFYIPPLDELSITSLLQYLYCHKKKTLEYLQEVDTPQAKFWSKSVVKLLEDFHIIGQYGRLNTVSEEELTTFIMSILRNICHNYFHVYPEMRINSPLIDTLPAITRTRNGILLSEQSEQRVIYSTIQLEGIIESILKEMKIEFAKTEKKSTRDATCIVYLIDSKIKIDERIARNTINGLIDIMHSKKTTSVEIENHTNYPLGKGVDLDHIMQFSTLGFQTDITVFDELRLYPI